MPITPAMSLNRVKIIDLPGLNAPERIRNKTAWQLVSSYALADAIRQQVDKLPLGRNLSDHDLRLAFNDCLTGTDARIKSHAENIAADIGRNLGYVLLTLKRGDPINRAARDEWTDIYWEHWMAIHQVWLGGGLMSGALGPYITTHAESVLHEAGYPDYVIRKSPYAADLVLVGAARHVPPARRSVLIFDFGGTFIKRARATYDDKSLIALNRLPIIVNPWEDIVRGTNDTQTRAEQLLDAMVSIIRQTWQESEMPPEPLIPVSIAAYVANGQPLLTQGGTYMQTVYATDNLQDELSRRLSDEIGESLRVLLLHDGTTAAAAHAGEQHTAVITIGTALGIGFPPDHITTPLKLETI